MSCAARDRTVCMNTNVIQAPPHPSLPGSLPPGDMSPATPDDHSPGFHPAWEAALRRPREAATEMIKDEVKVQL